MHGGNCYKWGAYKILDLESKSLLLAYKIGEPPWRNKRGAMDHYPWGQGSTLEPELAPFSPAVIAFRWRHARAYSTPLHCLGGAHLGLGTAWSPSPQLTLKQPRLTFEARSGRGRNVSWSCLKRYDYIKSP